MSEALDAQLRISSTGTSGVTGKTGSVSAAPAEASVFSAKIDPSCEVISPIVVSKSVSQAMPRSELPPGALAKGSSTAWFVDNVVYEEIIQGLEPEQKAQIDRYRSGETNLEFYYKFKDNRIDRVVVIQKDSQYNVSVIAEYKVNGQVELNQCDFSPEIFYLQKLLEGTTFLAASDYAPGVLGDETVNALYSYLSTKKEMLSDSPDEIKITLQGKKQHMFELYGFVTGMEKMGKDIDLRHLRMLSEAMRAAADLYEYAERILKMLPEGSNTDLADSCKQAMVEAKKKMTKLLKWMVKQGPSGSTCLVRREMLALKKKWELAKSQNSSEKRTNYEQCLVKYRQLFDQLQEFRSTFSWHADYQDEIALCLADLKRDLSAMQAELNLIDADPNLREKANLLYEYMDKFTLRPKDEDELAKLDKKYEVARRILDISADGPTKARAYSAFYAYLDESGNKNIGAILGNLSKLQRYYLLEDILMVVSNLYASNRVAEESGAKPSEIYKRDYASAYSDIARTAARQDISEEALNDVVNFAYILFSSSATYNNLLGSYSAYRTTEAAKLEAAGVTLPARGAVDFARLKSVVGQIAAIMASSKLDKKDQREIFNLLFGLPDDPARARVELARSYEYEVTSLAFAAIEEGTAFVQSAQVIGTNPRYISFLEEDYYKKQVLHAVYTPDDIINRSAMLRFEEFVDTEWTVIDYSVATRRHLIAPPKAIVLACLKAVSESDSKQVIIRKTGRKILVDVTFVAEAENYFERGDGITAPHKADLAAIIYFGEFSEALAFQAGEILQTEMAEGAQFNYTDISADKFALSAKGSVSLVTDETASVTRLAFDPPDATGTVYHQKPMDFMENEKIGTLILAIYGRESIPDELDLVGGYVVGRLTGEALRSAVKVFGEGKNYLRYGAPILLTEESAAMKDLIAWGMPDADQPNAEAYIAVLRKLVAYDARFTDAELRMAKEMIIGVDGKAALLAEPSKWTADKDKQAAFASAREKYVYALRFVAKKDGIHNPEIGYLTKVAAILDKYKLAITDHRLQEELPEEMVAAINASDKPETEKAADIETLRILYPQVMRVLSRIHGQLVLLSDKYPMEREEDKGSPMAKAQSLVKCFYRSFYEGIEEVVAPPSVLEFSLVGMNEQDMMKFNFWLYDDYVRDVAAYQAQIDAVKAEVNVLIEGTAANSEDSINGILGGIGIDALKDLREQVRTIIKDGKTQGKVLSATQKEKLQGLFEQLNSLCDALEEGLANPMQLLAALDSFAKDWQQLLLSMDLAKKELGELTVQWGPIANKNLLAVFQELAGATKLQLGQLLAKRDAIYAKREQVLTWEYEASKLKSRLMSDVFDKESYDRMIERLPTLSNKSVCGGLMRFFKSLSGTPVGVIYDGEGHAVEKTALRVLEDYFSQGGTISMMSSLVAPGESESATLAKAALSKVFEEIPRQLHFNVFVAGPNLLFGRGGRMEGIFHSARDLTAIGTKILGLGEIEIGPDNLSEVESFVNNPFLSAWYSAASWVAMISDMYMPQNYASQLHSIMVGSTAGQKYLDRKISVQAARQPDDPDVMDVVVGKDIEAFAQYLETELLPAIKENPFLKQRLLHLAEIGKFKTDIAGLINGTLSADEYLQVLYELAENEKLRVPLYDSISQEKMYDGSAGDIGDELVYLAQVLEDVLAIVGEKNRAAGIYSSEDMPITYFNPADTMRIATGSEKAPHLIASVRLDTEHNPADYAVASEAKEMPLLKYLPYVNGYWGDTFETIDDVWTDMGESWEETWANCESFTDYLWVGLVESGDFVWKGAKSYVQAYSQFKILMGTSIKTGFVDMWTTAPALFAQGKYYEGLERFFSGLGKTGGSFLVFETFGFVFIDSIFEDFKQGRYKEGIAKLAVIMKFVVQSFKSMPQLMAHAKDSGAVRIKNGAVWVDKTLWRKLGINQGKRLGRYRDVTVVREGLRGRGGVKRVGGVPKEHMGTGIKIGYYSHGGLILEAPRIYESIVESRMAAQERRGSGLALEIEPLASRGEVLPDVPETAEGRLDRIYNRGVDAVNLPGRAGELPGRGYDYAAEAGWRVVGDGVGRWMDAVVANGLEGVREALSKGSTPATSSTAGTVTGDANAVSAEIERKAAGLTNYLGLQPTLQDLVLLRAQLDPAAEFSVTAVRGGAEARALEKRIPVLLEEIVARETDIAVAEATKNGPEVERLSRVQAEQYVQLRELEREYTRRTGYDFYEAKPEYLLSVMREIERKYGELSNTTDKSRRTVIQAEISQLEGHYAEKSGHNVYFDNRPEFARASQTLKGRALEVGMPVGKAIQSMPQAKRTFVISGETLAKLAQCQTLEEFSRAIKEYNTNNPTRNFSGEFGTIQELWDSFAGFREATRNMEWVPVPPAPASFSLAREAERWGRGEALDRGYRFDLGNAATPVPVEISGKQLVALVADLAPDHENKRELDLEKAARDFQKYNALKAREQAAQKAGRKLGKIARLRLWQQQRIVDAFLARYGVPPEGVSPLYQAITQNAQTDPMGMQKIRKQATRGARYRVGRPVGTTPAAPSGSTSSGPAGTSSRPPSTPAPAPKPAAAPAATANSWREVRVQGLSEPIYYRPEATSRGGHVAYDSAGHAVGKLVRIKDGFRFYPNQPADARFVADPVSATVLSGHHLWKYRSRPVTSNKEATTVPSALANVEARPTPEDTAPRTAAPLRQEVLISDGSSVEGTAAVDAKLAESARAREAAKSASPAPTNWATVTGNPDSVDHGQPAVDVRPKTRPLMVRDVPDPRKAASGSAIRSERLTGLDTDAVVPDAAMTVREHLTSKYGRGVADVVEMQLRSLTPERLAAIEARLASGISKMTPAEIAQLFSVSETKAVEIKTEVIRLNNLRAGAGAINMLIGLGGMLLVERALHFACPDINPAVSFGLVLVTLHPVNKAMAGLTEAIVIGERAEIAKALKDLTKLKSWTQMLNLAEMLGPGTAAVAGWNIAADVLGIEKGSSIHAAGGLAAFFVPDLYKLGANLAQKNWGLNLLPKGRLAYAGRALGAFAFVNFITGLGAEGVNHLALDAYDRSVYDRSALMYDNWISQQTGAMARTAQSLNWMTNTFGSAAVTKTSRGSQFADTVREMDRQQADVIDGALLTMFGQALFAAMVDNGLDVKTSAGNEALKEVLASMLQDPAQRAIFKEWQAFAKLYKQAGGNYMQMPDELINLDVDDPAAVVAYRPSAALMTWAYDHGMLMIEENGKTRQLFIKNVIDEMVTVHRIAEIIVESRAGIYVPKAADISAGFSNDRGEIRRNNRHFAPAMQALRQGMTASDFASILTLDDIAESRAVLGGDRQVSFANLEEHGLVLNGLARLLFDKGYMPADDEGNLTAASVQAALVNLLRDREAEILARPNGRYSDAYFDLPDAGNLYGVDVALIDYLRSIPDVVRS